MKTRVWLVLTKEANEQLEFMHRKCALENEHGGYATLLGTLNVELGKLSIKLAHCGECGKGLGTQE